MSGMAVSPGSNVHVGLYGQLTRLVSSVLAAPAFHGFKCKMLIIGLAADMEECL
jgi:hypothetical protein